MVLGYSCLLGLRFFERQDLRALFSGLEQAFAFFGGIPYELLFDQMRADAPSEALYPEPKDSVPKNPPRGRLS